MLIWAPELWPETAENWYERYDDLYWQENWWTAGVREFSRDSSFPEWYAADVDAGPIISGYGTGASAFGIGAARANGRLDQAHSLSAEALVASWPLPGGSLVTPRLLSNLSGAPYLGESALLFNFTRTPLTETVNSANGNLPTMVYIGILLYAFVGIVLLTSALSLIRRWRTHHLEGCEFSKPRLQFFGWLTLIVSGLVNLLFFNALAGAFLITLAQFLPRNR